MKLYLYRGYIEFDNEAYPPSSWGFIELPSIKALTSASKRARLSMALMFTGKASHNRQAKTANDLLKVVVR
ncbi:hypothetical protein J6590_087102 [Homalodisca vitripennis]|nr:hypothetical protein J6590_087102 [Homalodisca vitripennis]